MALSCCVYLIEDDEPVARSLMVLLKICGYQVLRFDSADRFLRHVDELPPGCVLMDVTLPGTDGLAALDELRRRRLNWPVILMTGQDLSKLPRNTSASKPCALLEKPFALDRLHAALQAAGGKVPRQGTHIRRSVPSELEASVV